MNKILKQKLLHLYWLQYAGVNHYMTYDRHDKAEQFFNSLKEKYFVQGSHLPRRTATKQSVPKQSISKKNNTILCKSNSNIHYTANSGDSQSYESPKCNNIQDSAHLIGCNKSDIFHMNDDSNINKVRNIVNDIESLSELRAAVESFDGCALKKFAHKTVFGQGVTNSKIMCIGEAPGVKEDTEGIPFCGESGLLLDNLLSSIGLSRKKNIYVTNTVFWRPPANRTPTVEEIEICKPFLEKHISLINPNLIILVGSTAALTLLGIKNPMKIIRNTCYTYTNQYLMEPIKTVVIFHPAYLLRQPLKKKDMWYDLLKIKEKLTQHLGHSVAKKK